VGKKGCRGRGGRDRMVSTVSRPSACFAQALAGRLARGTEWIWPRITHAGGLADP
jgi:hypothetical protein